MPYIGPDTVDLIFRDPGVGVDDHGRPLKVDRVVAGIGNASVTVATATEVMGISANRRNGMVIRYAMKAMLPFVPDALALRSDCALVHDGQTFELSASAIPKRTLRGTPDHVRVYGTAEVPTDERGEQVTITPLFGRDLSGQPRPPGEPIVVVARSVTPGNTTRTIGDDGELDTADFTVALDLDVPVKDGDRIALRGKVGYARVSVLLEEWADRSTKYVLVKSRTGGVR